ncbi:hypothetical protein GUJ93_ZPchr0003g18303 [Zizania palustris]|uniref:Uncharacterized protein n=1 Tax=Zizania palustris TaxID=103762 RepID=A0A8J5SH39_ZIZPA|nr:hypothetical protein GUJ93_ZPchr0003g18303 [Zizania palustris]
MEHIHILQKHTASLGDNKALFNRPVRVKNKYASVAKGIFITYKEQVALDTGTKDAKSTLYMKVQDNEHGYIDTNEKIERYRYDTRKANTKCQNINH